MAPKSLYISHAKSRVKIRRAKEFSSFTVFWIFFTAEKKDSKNGAPRKFFGPSYFVMAIVISTYILINVLEKSSENAERKIVCTLCYRTFPTHDWTLDFSTMNFSILWGWKVRGWNVLTLVAFNSRLFNPEFWKVNGWKVSDWKKSGDEKPKEEKSGVEISRVEIYGGEKFLVTIEHTIQLTWQTTFIWSAS